MSTFYINTMDEGKFLELSACGEILSTELNLVDNDKSNRTSVPTYDLLMTQFKDIMFNRTKDDFNILALATEKMVNKLGGNNDFTKYFNLNGIRYYSLSEALLNLDSEKDNILKLMYDINLDQVELKDDGTYNEIPQITANLTIDLNGYTLTTKRTYTAAIDNVKRIFIVNSPDSLVDLTIKNGKINSHPVEGHTGVLSYNSNGHILIDDVQIIADNEMVPYASSPERRQIYVTKAIDVVLNNLNMDYSDYKLGGALCFDGDTIYPITLNNCTVKHNYLGEEGSANDKTKDSYGARWWASSVLGNNGLDIVINGGSYSGSGCAVLFIEMKGGTFELNDNVVIRSIWPDTTLLDMTAPACIRFEPKEQAGCRGYATAYINDATIIGKLPTEHNLELASPFGIAADNTAAILVHTDTGHPSVTTIIRNGNFLKFAYDDSSAYSPNCKFEIEAGTFDCDVTEYVAEGSAIEYDSATRTWIVKKAK